MAASKLTVAVTGPTGDIGRPFIRALEQSDEVGEIRAMARSAFDPDEHGWERATYTQGDVLDRDAVGEVIGGADVVVHLAFLIMGDKEQTTEINMEGSGNVFAAAVEAGVPRLVYTSSVAAYGFHPENELPLTEDVEARGTPEHSYSEQKATLEGHLWDALGGSDTDAYVFRPSIVAGPESLLLIENLPHVRIAGRIPPAIRRLYSGIPMLKPVLPDPGTPFQLVHASDVADALVAATVGRGEPGVYNLAAEGELTLSDVAEELGWYAVPVPDLTVDVAAEAISRLPFMPPELSWLQAFRTPVVMDASRAREPLGWSPDYEAR
ncbi:MAG: NAD-dependent epimerase/dehydratase family protein [Solirubrobacterales bacterium]